MYYVFTTEKAAKEYNQKVVSSINLGSDTTDWAIIFKHPSKSKWAILVNDSVLIDGKSKIELTSDWFEL